MALPRSTAGKTPSVRVSTPLALDGGIAARIASFDNLPDAGEHIALLFGDWRDQAAPLVRLHSECLTGDVFGSAHCDCGDQLRESRARLAREDGILLYLRQEGRGIGLYNKIDAYRAQHDYSLDTFAANRHIGFADDPRNFAVAADMLKALGIGRIRLITNNPEKAASLRANAIAVAEIIPTGRYEKPHNRRYLETKRKKGHTL